MTNIKWMGTQELGKGMSPAIGMGHLDICHTSQEFGVKLKLIVLPDQFIDRMKQANDCLAPITVESII